MSKAQNSVDTWRWPKLTRLKARLLGYRQHLIQTAVVRGFVEALCVQLILLPILGWMSSRHPYQAIWLQAMLATYVVYLWPLIPGFHAWYKAQFRLENLAKQLDRFNSGSPDVFRTLLSLENHGTETIAALNRNYAPWENKLRIPKAPWVDSSRMGWLGACLSFALIVPIFSGHSGDMVYRMVLPLSAWNQIPVPQLDPVDIPGRAALGDTLNLSVNVDHLPESEPVYAHVLFHGQEQRYRLERTGDVARFRFGPVQGDFDLRFSALSVETSEYSIQAVSPPYLHSFAAVVQPPVYTRLPSDSIPEMPVTLTLLPGSHVLWHITASQSLRKLQAIFRFSDAVPDTLDLGEGTTFTLRSSVRKPVELRLHLVTREDHLSGNAGPYRLEPGVDAPPEIAFLSPSTDGELGRNLQVPIVYRAQDDYGVSRVTLHYSVTGGIEGASSKGVKDISSWLQPGTGMGGGLWELKDLPLQPGNTVEIYLEATDNDVVSGPKTARSETIHLRMPSLEEVLAKVDATERGAITSLKSAAERQDRVPRQPQQAANESQPDAPPPLGAWEIRRILNSAPQDHLQRLERHLDAEAAKVDHDSPLGKQLESLRKETKEMEKHLPPTDAWQKPLPEQKKWLDTLMKNQQMLDQKLADLKSMPPPKDAKQQEPLAQERKALGDELQHNMKEQKDLQSWIKDQQQVQDAKRQDLQQTAQAQERAREDVKQALSQIQKTLEKGMENGVISPELLQKMERIQELLKEALPDSTLDRLKKDSQNEQVGMEDLQNNLKNLLDRQKDMRQGLDRAIKMLEMLRDMHALETLTKDVRDLQDKQEKLAEKIGENDDGKPDASKSDEELAAKQEELSQQLENDTKELNRLAKEQKAFQELKNQPHAQEAQDKMQETEKELGKNSSDKSQDGNDADKGGKKNSQKARKSAKSAAEELRKMADNMDGMMGQMNGGPDPAEISALLDETLEYGRWLDLIRDKNNRVREGWDEEDAALNQRAAQLARWLRNRLEKLAAEKPYENEVLRHEAAELGYQADAVLTANSAPAADSLLLHTRKAARELLKWLQQSNDQDGNDGEGSMSGNSGNGSGKKSGGKGKGKGQGEGDDEGLDGMSGRLKGVSGKQMAVNQATYQLLRQMLDSRSSGGKPGQGSPNGSMPLPGGGSSSGSNGMPGGSSGNMPGGSPQGGQSGSQPGGAQSGSQSGSQPGSQNGEGNSPGGVANSQQGVSEALEKMAESANDAGGAARKLRRLAQEARELEKGLRQGRIDPEELRKKQERFQTRLLEAANAMEERGRDRQRQAEAYRGGALKPDSNGTVVREDVFRELQRRREWARSLSLPAEQKRRIESYYEALLAH